MESNEYIHTPAFEILRQRIEKLQVENKRLRDFIEGEIKRAEKAKEWPEHKYEMKCFIERAEKVLKGEK